MKKCSAPILYVLPLLSVAAAVFLRRDDHMPDDPVSVGIGTVEDNSKYSGRTFPSIDDSKPEYILTLQNYRGVQYYAPVTLDSQKMFAVYDTGSFEIMAVGIGCTTCQIGQLTKYNSASSSTFSPGIGVVEEHHFAGGLVAGRQDYETVHVGNEGKDLTVTQMPFWQVVRTDMRVWMSDRAHFNAIVGLGHRTLQYGQVESLLERTDINRFALCLQRGLANPGYITFNPHLDAARGTSSMFRRLPVIGKNHWAVSMEEASVGATKACVGTTCLAIVDSGTSLIGVPAEGVPMVSQIMQMVKKDCSNINDPSLPDLVFVLGGQRFVLPPAAYVIKFPLDTGVVKCIPAFTDFKMQSDHGSVWILGMPFLRHFYTVFDRSEPSLYIADQGANCQPVSHNATVNTFVNTRPFQEPTIADTAEAMMPSFNDVNSILEI